MPRLFPACSEARAACPADASRSASVASAASLPLGCAATPVSPGFVSPVIPRVSTGRRLWSFLASMRSARASFSSPVTRPSSASSTVSRLLFHAFTESNRTPNHALQRTAPRVTVAAILACARLVRSWRCPTSIASFCAPPSQLPRHAPPSLSLGSLGDLPRLP